MLTALANCFVHQEFKPGDVIVAAGKPADQICLIAHGKVNKIGTSKYGDQTVLEVLADGAYFTYQPLLETQDTWDFTAKAITTCIVLTLQQQVFDEIAQSAALRTHIEQFKARTRLPQDRHGQAAMR